MPNDGKSTHVEFVYFKDSGKFYSDGELDIPFVSGPEGSRPVTFYEVLAVVREMLERGERPGLVNGHDFHTLVTIYTEFGPLRALFTRDADGRLVQARERHAYRCSMDDILAAMDRFGGGFVQQLAVLFRYADEDNRRALESTFRHYFKKYDETSVQEAMRR